MKTGIKMIARCPNDCGTWWLRLPRGYLRLNLFGRGCFQNLRWMPAELWRYIAQNRQETNS